MQQSIVISYGNSTLKTNYCTLSLANISHAMCRSVVVAYFATQGVVCTLHEGDDFGKLALVNDAPRSLFVSVGLIESLTFTFFAASLNWFTAK